MNNSEVGKAFAEGKKGKSGHMSTDGKKVFSYWALIAFKEGNKVYLIDRPYSVTTARHIASVPVGEQVRPYTKSYSDEKGGYAREYSVKGERTYSNRFKIFTNR